MNLVHGDASATVCCTACTAPMHTEGLTRWRRLGCWAEAHCATGKVRTPLHPVGLIVPKIRLSWHLFAGVCGPCKLAAVPAPTAGPVCARCLDPSPAALCDACSELAGSPIVPVADNNCARCNGLWDGCRCEGTFHYDSAAIDFY